MEAQRLFPVEPVLACGDRRGSTAGYYMHRRAAGGASACEECAAAERAYQKGYRQSPKGKTKQKAWQQSPEGKAMVKAYNQSPKGKATRKAYRQLPEGKAAVKAYNQSPKGKASKARRAHRRRALKAGVKSDDWNPEEVLKKYPICVCEKCDAPADTIDHEEPLGIGDNTRKNVRGMCRQCNASKQRTAACRLELDDHNYPRSGETN